MGTGAREVARVLGMSPNTEREYRLALERSVGSVGDSYDNALAETINGLCKTEVIYRSGP